MSMTFSSDQWKQGERHYDGIICFGGLDWWYHNRGHYDMQMMREFSEHMPVLYVNSIGMRAPTTREGRMFFKRVTRKLRSISRGFQQVRPNFGVLSPLTMPGGVRGIWRHTLLHQVRSAARKMNIHQPLLWVACPPVASVVSVIPHQGMVYQRTDRMETFPGVNETFIRECDISLKSVADITLFVSTHLHEMEGGQCRYSLFADHGCDVQRFMDANVNLREPVELKSIAKPRVGFVGGIDRHTFDPELFNRVVSLLPDVQFVLVGGCSLEDGWYNNKHRNVHLLGKKPYEQVADYMAACDVLIMPWNQSDWIQACNPVKLKEYLAVGRPIVSTPFPELARYGGLVEVADTPQAFAQAIRHGLEQPVDPSLQRKRITHETWSAKAQLIARELAKIGLKNDMMPVWQEKTEEA